MRRSRALARSALAALLGLAALAHAGEASQEGGGKRALIVAVAAYASPEWDTLSSGNDVELVRAALELHGFAPESIHVLTDAAATKAGIEEAVESYLGAAQPGDVVFLHYSGHGQRITDDDGDEPDGYDEAWVPHDAPKSGEGYSGERHLRDDELNRIVQDLRRTVGPTGNVILSIDSCYSGGTSRGMARVRGGPPLGPPAPGPRASASRSVNAGGDDGGGFFEEGPRTRSVAGEAPGLAPYVVFSAARHDQVDYETIDGEGRVVGPLSFALSQALASPEPIGTYRELFERVEGLMQAWVPNRPQVEGNIDAELFSGRAVVQHPFVEVTSVQGGGKQVVLAAGSLQGLLKGSRLELHRAGAREPSPDTLLAGAVVSDASYLEAVADLETPAKRSELQQSRAFVTSHAFGDLRIRVALAGLGDPALRQHLETSLADVAAVELDDADPDLAVRSAAGGEVVVEDARSGEAIFAPEAGAAPELAAAIRARLVDAARSRYLRSLHVDAEGNGPGVLLEVVPLDPTRCRDARDPSTCAELDPSAKRVAGMESIWKIGDPFKLRARNATDRALYVTILDLPADGTVNALWPIGPTTERKRLSAGETWTPDVVYQFAEPAGNDVLLLIATEDWTNFRPFLTGSGQQRAAPGSLGPFAPLFDDAAVRTRAAVAYEPGSVVTHAVTVTVER